MQIKEILKNEQSVDIAKQVKDIFSKIDISKLSEYKKDVKTCKIDMPNSAFKAIYGELIINKPINQVMNIFTEHYSDINEKSDQDLAKIHVSQKMYFDNEEDKLFNNNTTHFLIHSVARSPAPMVVAHREVFCHGVRVNEENVITQYLVSIDKFCESSPKSVEGKVIAVFFKFEKQENCTKFSQFSYLDPAGKVPPMIFNIALDNRNDILLAIKKLCERESVE